MTNWKRTVNVNVLYQPYHVTQILDNNLRMSKRKEMVCLWNIILWIACIVIVSEFCDSSGESKGMKMKKDVEG